MKTSSIVAAISGLFALVSGNTCDGSPCDGCGAFINSWIIHHDGGVDFSEPFCKGFWDNLECVAPSVTDCGNDPDGKGFISFNAGTACNGGDIDRAWGLATNNEFGSIKCLYSN